MNRIKYPQSSFFTTIEPFIVFFILSIIIFNKPLLLNDLINTIIGRIIFLIIIIYFLIHNVYYGLIITIIVIIGYNYIVKNKTSNKEIEKDKLSIENNIKSKPSNNLIAK